MTRELGLYSLDGSFRSQEEIKKSLETHNLQFLTPLPQAKSFQFWSDRFKNRQIDYQETQQRKNHVEIKLEQTSLINFIGDLHIGAPDTNYQRIEQEAGAIVNTPYSYVVAMGDWVDGFFFNPAQMQQIEQPPEQFTYMRSLITFFASSRRLLVAFGGDHDLWASKMGIDPYNAFSEATGAYYMQGVGYITLYVGEQEYRITASHQMPGFSMYNPNHPQKRLLLFGGAMESDIIIGAHTHQKGYSCNSVTKFGGENSKVHLISIGAYKSTDEYSRKRGLTPKSPTPSDMYGCTVKFSKEKNNIQYFEDILEANQTANYQYSPQPP